MRSLSILVIRARTLAGVSGSSSLGAAFQYVSNLPDLLAPEGALLVMRELDAEAFVKQALGVLAARSLVGAIHPRDS